MLMGVLGKLLASWEACKRVARGGGESQGGGVKLTNEDKHDILGGSIFLLLLATALFLSCFL
jgi:hypothetical protein